MYSLFQVTDSEEAGSLQVDCSSALRPLQYSSSSDPDAGAVRCAWPGYLSLSRLLVCGVVALAPMSCAWGLVKKRKWAVVAVRSPPPLPRLHGC